MPKFTSIKWNGYTLKLFQNYNDIRSTIPLIPYFWDSEIALDLLVKIPPDKRTIDMDWDYSWQLIDLDGNVIKKGQDKLRVTNKGLRRKMRYWSSGKCRAIPLGNLKPNMYYNLFISFHDGIASSEKYLAASLTVKDREDFHTQILLVLFTIAMTLYFSAVAKGCGV